MQELQEPISGRYRLQHPLRRGGMSEVYLAYDELLQRDVALKLVSGDDHNSIQRLHREEQIISKLSHDHILPTLDYGEHGSYHYLVMPYMKRGTLRERIAKGRLAGEEAGNILAQVASALQLMHDHGIIHRDVKPSNILLDDVDERHVYLADFGLAKVMGEGSDLTQTGSLIGTPEYLAPELVDRPESVSSDIYALGVLLYHMLTGRPPFTGSTPLAVYWKHIRELPEPPSHLDSSISHPVEQVILRALNKDPDQRFPSVKAMSQAYAAALRLPEPAESAPVLPDLSPALITLHRVDSTALPAIIRQAAPVPQWQNLRHKIQKAMVALAVVALVIAPLSLGFLLGRYGSVKFTGALQQAHSASLQQTTGAVLGSIGNTMSLQLTPSIPSHKHTHKHKHGNGNDD
jgi:serine/threonine protein kinase